MLFYLNCGPDQDKCQQASRGQFQEISARDPIRVPGHQVKSSDSHLAKGFSNDLVAPWSRHPEANKLLKPTAASATLGMYEG